MAIALGSRFTGISPKMELMVFENYLLYLNEQPKSKFRSLVNSLDMNLLANESLLTHAQYSNVVKQILHKCLKVEKKLAIQNLVKYLRSIDAVVESSKTVTSKRYPLSKYTKKCSVQDLILFLKYADDMNVYDYLMHYERYPDEITSLIMANPDYKELEKHPYLVVELGIKHHSLRSAILPLVKQLLEISELIGVGTRFCLECLKVYKSQEIVVSSVLESCLDSKLIALDRNESLSDDFVIYYLHEEPDSPKYKSDVPYVGSKMEDLGITEKQRILQSLEESDDEYNDTYDDLIPTNQLEDVSKTEQLLVAYYLNNPEIFHKSSKGTKERLKLIKDTGMSDEQLQGWYTMLNRSVISTKLEGQGSNFGKV